MQSTAHRELSATGLIYAAVNNVFQNWEAFKIGTSMGKRSKEIAEWVIDVTTKVLFENTDVEDGAELGEWIGDILDHEFNLIVEDGSLQEVGNQIIVYWKMYQNQQLLELADILDKRSAETPAMNVPPQIQAGSSSSEDSSDEEMDTSAPQAGPSNENPGPSSQHTSPNDDGWITITKNKRR